MTTQQAQTTVDAQKQLSKAVLNHRPVIVVDIYCRVSTEDQEENTSLDIQEADGRQYIKEHGFIVGMVHREVASGFSYREREDLSLLRERYLAGKIQGVVIRTYDRLSRSQVHFAILLEEMEHAEIALHCVKEQLDDTPIGRFTRMVLSFVAEMEREKIIDRTMAGRIKKAQEGRVVGGIKARYGWKWIYDEKGERDYIALDEEAAETLKWAGELYADGVSCLEIIRRLTEKNTPSPAGKEWTPRTLRRFLEDPRNTGKNARMFVNPKKTAKQHFEPIELPDGTYPAIFSEELYARIMLRAEANKEDAAKKGYNPEEYLLRAGFIRCRECGKAMTAVLIKDKRGRPDRLVYRCVANVNKCKGQNVPSIKLDNEVWAMLQKLADHAALIEKAIALATNAKTVLNNTKAIDSALEKWRQTASNYLEDLKDSALTGDTRSAIRGLLNDANKKIAEFEEERTKIMLTIIDKDREKAAYEKILNWCKKAKEAREEMSYTEKRDFLRLLGLRVFVTRVDLRYEEISYNVEVALPEIQNLISCFVGQPSTSVSHKTRYLIGFDREGFYINPALLAMAEPEPAIAAD